MLKNYEKGVANFPSLLLGGKLIPEKKPLKMKMKSERKYLVAKKRKRELAKA